MLYIAFGRRAEDSRKPRGKREENEGETRGYKWIIRGNRVTIYLENKEQAVIARKNRI